MLNNNRLPVLAPVSDREVAESGSLTLSVTASDADGDALSFSITGLPSFGSVTDHGDGTATLSFTPGLSDAGSYTLTVAVSDGSGSVNDSFVLTVSGTNQAPVLANPGSQNHQENDAVSFVLSGSDADGDALVYSASGLPEGISVNASSGVVSGTLSYSSAGSYSVTVTVTDNGAPSLSASQSFTWTVSNSNRLPVLSAIADQAVAEGDSLEIALAATDADGDALNFSVSGAPSFISLTENGDGSGSLTASPGFDVAGNYSIIVQVSDGAGISSESFDLQVTGTNRAPELINPGAQNTLENTAVNLTLSGSDSDGDR